LKDKGYHEDKEHIVIEGLPVQFIPAYNDLVVEAVTHAQETRFKKTATRVVRPEYLVAILLQTDRPKDRARLPQGGAAASRPSVAVDRTDFANDTANVSGAGD